MGTIRLEFGKPKPGMMGHQDDEDESEEIPDDETAIIAAKDAMGALKKGDSQAFLDAMRALIPYC